MYSVKIIASALLASSLFIAPAEAAGLLRGLLNSGSSGGGSDSTGGGTSVGHVASIGSGSAGTDSAVNVGLGGGGGNIADANIGNGLTSANVGLGGDGLFGVDANVGNDLVTANVGVGGNGLLDVGAGVGGGTGIPGIPGGPGISGAPGASGTLGYGGGAGGGGVYGFYGLGVAGAACRQDVRGLARLLSTSYSNHEVSSWSRAAGVQVVKVPMCSQVKASVGRAAAANASIGMMRGVAAADPLISTSLGRARTNASHVLGVDQAKGNLTVYVY